MTKSHFVEAYEKQVEHCINTSDNIDEAMSNAVGGHYVDMGEREKNILVYAGLKSDMSIIDYGCGSGRLAHALSNDPNFSKLQYLGVDIIDEMLDYAASKSHSQYVFKNHRELSVPAESDSKDMICAFSLFTHLLHEETYIYLEDMKRVLKKDGILVFSFTEFGLEYFWPVFSRTVEEKKKNANHPINVFIERSVIKIWSKKLGFKVVKIVDGNKKAFNNTALGQSIAILKKIG
jgi:SAM-dependent methyltransferase